MAGLDQLRAQLSARARALPARGPGVRAAALCVTLIVLAACNTEGARDGEPASQSPLVATLAGRVPMDTALARFRTGLPPVRELRNGSATLDGLVRRFANAVENGDTAAVRDMLLSRAEFAYIYFPQTVYVRPPYLQDPALAWFLSIEDSRKGITRTFDRFAGRPRWLLRHECDAEPRLEGDHRIWSACRVLAREHEGDGAWMRVFGPIIEHNGRYKFVTYGGDL